MSTENLLALTMAVALGCAACVGHALLGGYVIAHLPLALVRHPVFLLLSPGLISALITGFLLAAVASVHTSRLVVAVAVSATLPWVGLHIWVWIHYGNWRSWWVVLSDTTSLVAAAYGFAVMIRWWRLRKSSDPSSMRTRPSRAA